MITFLVIWFLLSCLIGPLVGAVIAYGQGNQR